LCIFGKGWVGDNGGMDWVVDTEGLMGFRYWGMEKVEDTGA